MAEPEAGRCEPPPELIGENGWHWVACGRVPPTPFYWMRAMDDEPAYWEDGGDPAVMFGNHWRYVEPVLTPREMAALRAAHDRRVTELLEANNALVEQRRAIAARCDELEAQNADLLLVQAQSDPKVTVEFGPGEGGPGG